ncbi:unnamed protein product [Closterium sp. Naga37s-1]|nr:unnamed protein product [Closterium sp. Naga37s-1]
MMTKKLLFCSVSSSVLIILALLEIAARAKSVTAAPRNGSEQSPPPDLVPKEEILSTCKFPGEINITVSPDFIGTTWRGLQADGEGAVRLERGSTAAERAAGSEGERGECLRGVFQQPALVDDQIG